MPTQSAPTGSFVRMNGTSFPIVGSVQNFIASRFPDKYVTGEFSLDTHPFLSTVEWRDFRRGIGRDTYDEQDKAHAWWATTSLRHAGHNVLQRRSVQTAAASSTGAVGFLGDIGTAVLAGFGTAVHSYNNSTDSWGSSVRTLANAATDSLSAMIAGTYTLVVAQGSDVDWTTDGSSWNRNTTDIDYVAFWRELLWGIDATTGILYFTSTLSSGFTADATLRLEAEAATRLFVGPAADGDSALYCATTRGLYVFDSTNSKFRDSGFRVPYHPNNGKGALSWRGNIYYPAGHAVYEYNPVTGAVRIMGPDMHDGLPSDRRGAITTMVGSHNDLIAGINSATGTTTTIGAFLGTETITQLQVYLERDAGYPTILGWAGGDPPDEANIPATGNGGWEVKWPSGSQGDSISALHVSNQYSSYRLWWGSGGRVFYQVIPTDIVNPSQVTTSQYESSGLTETPWFVVPGNQVGVAMRVFLETRNPTSSETVAVAYARNFVETFTTLGTNSSAGEQAYNFQDSSSNNTGVTFRAIRFRNTLTRGSTNTNTPDVIKLAFAYKRTFTYLKGFRAVLDLTRPFNGLSVKQMREALDTILELAPQFEFFYRDESGEADQVYYVTIVPDQYQGADQTTGRLERGTHVVTVVESI